MPSSRRMYAIDVKLSVLQRREWFNALGKVILQEDEKDHEFLRIDMGWGIRNGGPETLKQLPYEVDAPYCVRCVRRHLQLAVFEERSNRGRTVETREAIQRRSQRDSADNEELDGKSPSEQ